MITPAYIRTMAEYNAEMNRRLYGAAARLSDAERRLSRDAFWGSIHGTLTHLLWGDQQWMSRFDMDRLEPQVTMQTAPLKLYLSEDLQEAAGAFAEERKPGPFKGR